MPAVSELTASSSTAHASTPRDNHALKVLVGYDGSPSAANAIAVGALLMPSATARIAHVWTPPFASRELRARLRRRAGSLHELTKLVEREGLAEAQRLVGDGVAVATAAGWRAEPLVERCYGDTGFHFAEMVERDESSAVIVGGRGLSGARAVMGSVSDATVHYSAVPVLVIGHPTLTTERRAAANGPIVVGYDGSTGAERALASASSLFPDRRLILASVGDDTATADTIADVQPAAETVRLERRPSALGRGRAIAEALAGLAATRDAAAVVVGSRGQSAHREIILGSVAMAVLHHVRRPVAVVPEPRTEDTVE
jgi:nucleotide-binding universal stress UspA family protein